jgi:hypothetical protein
MEKIVEYYNLEMFALSINTYNVPTLKNTIYKRAILPLIFYGYKTWPLALREGY